MACASWCSHLYSTERAVLPGKKNRMTMLRYLTSCSRILRPCELSHKLKWELRGMHFQDVEEIKKTTAVLRVANLRDFAEQLQAMSKAVGQVYFVPDRVLWRWLMLWDIQKNVQIKKKKLKKRKQFWLLFGLTLFIFTLVSEVLHFLVCIISFL